MYDKKHYFFLLKALLKLLMKFFALFFLQRKKINLHFPGLILLSVAKLHWLILQLFFTVEISHSECVLIFNK